MGKIEPHLGPQKNLILMTTYLLRISLGEDHRTENESIQPPCLSLANTVMGGNIKSKRHPGKYANNVQHLTAGLFNSGVMKRIICPQMVVYVFLWPDRVGLQRHPVVVFGTTVVDNCSIVSKPNPNINSLTFS